MKKTYKLRAECMHDVVMLLNLVPIDQFAIECKRIPDVEITFRSNFTMEDVIAALKRILDSHVMIETVQPLNKYTGKRREK